MGSFKCIKRDSKTQGITQITFENYKHELFNFENIKPYYLLKKITELMSMKVKFYAEEVIFSLEDNTKGEIWLELGNDGRGFKHIIIRHLDQLSEVFKDTNKDSLLKNIFSVLKNGKIIYERRRVVNGKEQDERLYATEECGYFLVAIGTNGYIVSIYPRSKPNFKKKGEKND